MTRKLALVLLFSVAAVPAFADTPLVLGSGWQSDTLGAIGSPTSGSNWTFTLASGAHFSVVDCCIVGDTYTLSGSVTGTTSFYAGTGIQADGTAFYGTSWSSAAWSKIDKYLGPGSYAIGITGDGVGGIPAGLGVRLDSTVPEPAVWGLMIGGFGMVGAAMRRRITSVLA